MQRIHEIKSNLLHYRAEYDSDQKVIYICWEGLSHLDSIVELFKKMMAFMRTHQVIGIVQNGEQMKGTFIKANKFIGEQVIPFFDKCGVKYNIGGFTMDVFTRFSLEQLLKIINTKVELNFFKSFAEAKTYIEGKMNVKLAW